MKVRHPQYGSGTVKTISEAVAEIQFDDGTKRAVAPEASGLEPMELLANINCLEMPLRQLVAETLAEALKKRLLEKSNEVVEQLGVRWHGGKLVLHPADATLQTKEVPLEVFFHKVVIFFQTKTC